MADEGAPLAPPGDLVELGRIVSAYGIRGWVKVQPHSSQAEVLRSAPQWWLTSLRSPLQAVGSSRAKDVVRYDVVQVRPQGSTIVAELKGLRDRNDAEALRGQIVSVSRADFPAASAEEYYWVDLIGCQVFGVSSEAMTEANGSNSQGNIPEKANDIPVFLGVVHEVGDNGAHAILQVHRQRLLSDGKTESILDAKGRPQELLIPFVAAHVSNVDLRARRIDTNWPDAF
jgi:16S rRNA processing protein RimM